MSDQYLWVESYRPKLIADCILPARIKDVFGGYVKEGEFPNLILAGPAGSGKTSISKALCDELGVDMLFVNASLDRGIGDIRTTVASFASTVSLTGDKKVVLLDEADNLTQDSQKALRALIEEFQNHCRFILTCNYPHNIIDAIHSRCTVFDFHVRDQKEVVSLSGEFFKRVVKILKEKEVTFDQQVLAKFIMAKAPDWRGVLNTVQGNIHDGELSTDILSTSADALVELLKAKRWNDVSTWIFENAHLHPRQVESSLYRALQNQITNQSKPQAVLIFGEYSHKLMSGADPCITLLALCAQLMVEMDWS